jgi:hypothetical protein
VNSSPSTTLKSHFRSAHYLYHRNFDDAFARIFGRRFCITVDHGCASNRKSAKVLSMPDCGMRVGMDIGVIRDHVSRVYRYLSVFLARRLRCLEDSLFRKARDTIGPPRCGERGPEGMDDFVNPSALARNAAV